MPSAILLPAESGSTSFTPARSSRAARPWVALSRSKKNAETMVRNCIERGSAGCQSGDFGTNDGALVNPAARNRDFNRPQGVGYFLLDSILELHHDRPRLPRDRIRILDRKLEPILHLLSCL